MVIPLINIRTAASIHKLRLHGYRSPLFLANAYRLLSGADDFSAPLRRRKKIDFTNTLLAFRRTSSVASSVVPPSLDTFRSNFRTTVRVPANRLPRLENVERGRRGYAKGAYLFNVSKLASYTRP